MENKQSVQKMLAEKERRQAERKRMKEEFKQWLKELLCAHQKDYVGYVCYASYRQAGKRERYMYNIDAVGMCPKCGRIFDYRKSYMRGLSQRRAAETLKRLQEGGYVVAVAEQGKNKKLKVKHGTGGI